MPTHKIDVAMRTLATASLLAALLAGCGSSAAPEAVPAPPPASESPAADTPPADATPAASPTDSPAAPAQPAPEAPPPKDPAASPTPAALSGPAVSSMSVARASAKITVPVDLRFQFDGPVVANQPVTLHLAAVPRTSGGRLTVSVKPVAGLRMDAAPLSVQKANADGVYRQQLSLTALEGAPASLSVMVTMEMDQGTGFGFFTVPLEAGTVAQKQKTVKQR